MPGYLFTTILNMSITATVVAGLIILFRWAFGRRLPRIFSYALWAIVLLRLLVPFSLKSEMSIFNVVHTPETVMSVEPQIQEASGNIPGIPDNGSISVPAEASQTSADPMKTAISVMFFIWIFGAAGLLSFFIFAYFHALHRFREGVLYKQDNLILQCRQLLKLSRKVLIYVSDRAHTPVVCGLIKVRIILPLDIVQSCSELELKHIITHELVHIKRFDHILKPLSVLALCVHWFNPLVWVGFILSQKDMEMSCDERVVSVFKYDIRSEYATSLIKLAVRQNALLNGALLAFGESSIKSRVKGIMGFRKPGFWVGCIVIAALIVAGITLLTDRKPIEVYRNISNESSAYSRQITGFAKEIIKRDIANYEANPEVKIKDSRITRLELIETFNSLADAPVEVYALEYRILPEDLKKVVLAGGTQFDEDGWLKETCSMGSPLLVVFHKDSSPKLLGILWTGGVGEGDGLEAAVKALINQSNGTDAGSLESDASFGPETTIRQNNRSLEGISRIISENYFKYIEGSSIPESERIKDYKINGIKVEEKGDMRFVFSVDCSILAASDKYINAGNGTPGKNGWIEHKFFFVKVQRSGDKYKIVGISTGR